MTQENIVSQYMCFALIDIDNFAGGGERPMKNRQGKTTLSKLDVYSQSV
jgi:hypothetical protein